ncbi:Uncharacterised protein [uncultured archaeon]|nr:Uncharacterised protein [uncultured archaeon]
MKKNIFSRYPKLIILAIVIIVSYFLFSNQLIRNLISNLDGFGYLGTFIAGMGYTFGFTSPLSAGFFLTMRSENIFLIGIIGGIGAMFADLVIFKFVRFSFSDEFHRLRKSKIGKRFKKIGQKYLGKRTRKVLGYLVAGILIASPLPDEAGIIILAGLTKIHAKVVAGLSFFLDTIGIIVLLWISNLL